MYKSNVKLNEHMGNYMPFEIIKFGLVGKGDVSLNQNFLTLHEINSDDLIKRRFNETRWRIHEQNKSDK